MTSYTKPQKPPKVTESLFAKSDSVTLLALLVFLIFIAPAVSVFAQTSPPATNSKALEIVYPVFSGEGGTLTPDSGLPGYVRYVFKFAMAIIGLIILGVMIYSGIQYVLSTGSAEKLLDARKGILASFLGALILIGAFVLFNTINPDLTKLNKIDDLEAIDPVIIPGIYLCSYNPPDLRGFITTYLNREADPEDRVKAVKGIKGIMSKSNKENCYRVKFSADLTKKDLDLSAPQTMFTIPKRPTNPDNPWEYNYGIIFHEEDSWKGKCYPEFVYTNYDVRSFPVTSTPSDIKPKSITLFERPTVKINASNVGVKLFQCLDHSTTKNCPTDVASGRYGSFPAANDDLGKDVIKVSYDSLKRYGVEGPNGTERRKGIPGQYGSTIKYITTTTYTEEEKKKGARSVIIDPEGGYFAIMFSGKNWQKDSKICEVISKNDLNLLDQPIGQCGDRCKTATTDTKEFLRDCVPCLKSMTVVKGHVLY